MTIHRNKSREIKIGSRVAIKDSFMNSFDRHKISSNIPNHNHGVVNKIVTDHEHKHSAALSNQTQTTIKFEDDTEIVLYSGSLINLY